ncbi:AAA family ATPase [Falsirhodobacter algicola]|uniref:Phosphonate metabolism protein/1,5-bisphosphokinase (PRPP-forming) PhnN n=1 Tax=Falsirhodobacter algicola TaxID=2692330 RepID=A0A8J8SLX2_9RHOB|nr:AAA family ATPase [Falsirhodobacter algicola]QUS37003.1 phosphonate metabolism protein/1,5-bisphosphokinase (PRPP-forming) PhnN [Falsirhodobacter algicola]
MKVFAVVGASGAGKDTLLAALQARRSDLTVLRRVITRPERPGDEPFEGVDPATFAARAAAGDFALIWEAHGLRYAVPRPKGVAGTVLFNGSRSRLGDAARAFAGLEVIHVTAPLEIRAARLAARGREDPDDMRRRLRRAAPLPPGLTVHEIDNGGPLDHAVAAALAVLEARCQIG